MLFMGINDSIYQSHIVNKLVPVHYHQVLLLMTKKWSF